MNTTRPPNMRGAMTSRVMGGARASRSGLAALRTEGNLARFPSVTSCPPTTQAGCRASLQGAIVAEVGFHVAGQHRHTLDQLGNALEAQEREADREEDLDRPADETACVR